MISGWHYSKRQKVVSSSTLDGNSYTGFSLATHTRSRGVTPNTGPTSEHLPGQVCLKFLQSLCPLQLLPAGEERLGGERPVLPESVHGGGGEGEGGQEVGQGQVHHQDVS